MSQAKVDRYKYEKAHRKEIMKKEKRKKILTRTAALVVCAAIVCWVGYSMHRAYQDKQPRKSYEADYKAMTDYMTKLSAAK